jgi:hypothetical protein
LTSTSSSSTGSLWNSEPNLADDWEVEIGFKVSGARYLGGDGFAFWCLPAPLASVPILCIKRCLCRYTEKRNTVGSTFGNDHAFVGLGVMFDSCVPPFPPCIFVTFCAGTTTTTAGTTQPSPPFAATAPWCSTTRRTVRGVCVWSMNNRALTSEKL